MGSVQDVQNSVVKSFDTVSSIPVVAKKRLQSRELQRKNSFLRRVASLWLTLLVMCSLSTGSVAGA